MKINELKIGDTVKFNWLGGIREGKISLIHSNEFEIQSSSGVWFQVNKTSIISKIETIKTFKEIPIILPKMTFEFVPTKVDIKNAGDVQSFHEYQFSLFQPVAFMEGLAYFTEGDSPRKQKVILPFSNNFDIPVDGTKFKVTIEQL